jgi:hypothetical protein
VVEAFLSPAVEQLHVMYVAMLAKDLLPPFQVLTNQIV